MLAVLLLTAQGFEINRLAGIAYPTWRMHSPGSPGHAERSIAMSRAIRPDQVIEAHEWLRDAGPFDRALFDRWLEILDAGWTGGPIAVATAWPGP